MTTRAFIEKWKAADLTERAAAQEHFCDLCALLGERTPATADPNGEWYAFEKGASKTSGGSGWADVWKRDHFAWEYKKKGRDLAAALHQLQGYVLDLENPPLLVVCDIDEIRVHTTWTKTLSLVYRIGLEDLQDEVAQRLLKCVFSDPDQLNPDANGDPPGGPFSAYVQQGPVKRRSRVRPAAPPTVPAALAAAAKAFSKAALPRRIGYIRERTRGPHDDRDPFRRIAEHEAWRESAHASYGRDRFERAPLDPDQVLAQLTGRTTSNATFALVLGEPGAGKTTLLENWVAKRLAGSAGKALAVAFIRLEQLTLEDAKELCGRGNTAATAAELAGATDIPGVGQLLAPSLDRSILWVLDALDELRPEISGARLVGKLLGRLARLPGQVVISCRSAIWQSLPSELTRYADQVHRYEILPLDRPQQIAVLTRRAVRGDRIAWSPERATDLVERICRNIQMREIAGNALLLELIAEVDDSPEGGRGSSLPASRASFFDQAVAVRWNKDTVGPKMHGHISEARQILMNFAGILQLNELSGTGDQFTEAIAAAETEIPEPDWRRAFTSAGLLAVRNNQVRFDHLTFQEYFLANWHLGQGRSIGVLLDQFWMDPRYEETLAMLVGVAADKNTTAVDHALAQFVQGWLDRHKDDPNQLWKPPNHWGLERPRSPTRTALHVLSRSGERIDNFSALKTQLDKLRAQSVRLRFSLSCDPSTPTATLTGLANDRDTEVRSSVAENPSTPAKTLTALAGDQRAQVRIRVAWNPSTPAETLTALAGDRNREVRYSIARNPSTPAKRLAALAGQCLEIRFRVAENPSAPAETLTELAGDRNPAVRLFVARNPSTPAETLAALAGDQDLEVRRSAAGNPSTPAEALAALAGDQDFEVRRSAAGNPSTSTETLTALAGDNEPVVRRWVANNPSTSAEILAALAGDQDRSPDVLAGRASDQDPKVRCWIARSSSTPTGTLAALAGDHEPDVRRWVANNPSTPAEVLVALAGDPDLYVRYRVAENLSTPIQTLAALAHDQELGVRSFVAHNHSTPAEVLAELADDEYPEVRRSVAGNPSTPAETLVALAGDGDPSVRGKVTQNDSCPANAWAILAWDEDMIAWRTAAPTSNPLLEDLVAWKSREEVLAAIAKGKQSAPD